MTNPTLIEQAITEHWGDRCPETEPGCPCCDAWAEYDALTASRAQSVTDAARKLIEHWDDKGGKEERGSYEGVEYWSPSARMIDTQFVVYLRAALALQAEATQ